LKQILQDGCFGEGASNCVDCKAKHFKKFSEEDPTKFDCIKCNKACKGECSGSSASDCVNNECAAGYELTTPEDGIETCTQIPKPTSPPTPSPEENDEDDAKKEAEKAGPHKEKKAKMDPQSSWERATMANGIQSDMAEMTKKYLKKLYYRERFEVINKGISTITAIWIICFLDYSKTITCLLVLATIVTNVLLYGYSSTDTIRN